MGSGGYVIGEWASINKGNSSLRMQYQTTLAKLESEILGLCQKDWSRSFDPSKPFGGGENFGRTTILPELFDDWANAQMSHWRQNITSSGHQTIMTGTRSSNTIPEDFKIAWAGIALPNKQQHLTELKWQIGDTKFGRIDIEEVNIYEKPAIIFEDGFIVDEEESFDLYGYIEGPLATDLSGLVQGHTRIVLLGAAYYRQIDKVLGNCGAAI